MARKLGQRVRIRKHPPQSWYAWRERMLREVRLLEIGLIEAELGTKPKPTRRTIGRTNRRR